MPLKPYEEDEPLAFPIRGKVYTLGPVGIDAGLRLSAILAGTEKAPKDQQVVFRLAMGDVWDEMRADGVPVEAGLRAGLSAMADFQSGRLAAEAIWEAGVDPKALEAWIAGQQDSTPSPSMAKATSTRKRATTSGTTSRPTTRRSAAKK